MNVYFFFLSSANKSSLVGILIVVAERRGEVRMQVVAVAPMTRNQ